MPLKQFRHYLQHFQERNYHQAVPLYILVHFLDQLFLLRSLYINLDILLLVRLIYQVKTDKLDDQN